MRLKPFDLHVYTPSQTERRTAGARSGWTFGRALPKAALSTASRDADLPSNTMSSATSHRPRRSEIPNLQPPARVPPADLVPEPSQKEIEAALPKLQRYLDYANAKLRDGAEPDGETIDKFAMPFMLAAMNREIPGLNAREITFGDTREFFATPQDGLMRGVLRFNDHFVAVELRKSAGRQELVHLDNIPMAYEFSTGAPAFRSRLWLTKIAHELPQLEVTYATTKVLGGYHDCGMFALDACVTAALHADELAQGLAAAPAVAMPDAPRNFKAIADGEDHLPVALYRHSQGKSRLEGKPRFAQVLQHWNRPENRIERTVGLKMERKFVNRSIEHERAACLQKAVDYCRQRLA